ncbi:WxL domain-containing protein [Isobaculum melis]|uniref:WxL domain surface cell wall-binding n=1 Tax=Isobaculum melis TaxID=142588 RepID=A0A1H9PWQ7_9LACT|nr:WxL domain-containing protein [Isobaculum melis]SER52612.1 WxL domain surface cell wall-binding [Isobaculum melis]
MKKKVTLLLVSATLLGGFLVNSHSASAEIAGTMNSITDVTFTQDTTPTNPVSPTDPNTPVSPVNPTDPNDPHTPGTAGPLSIDYVSNFHFGSKIINDEDMIYYAKLDNVLQAGSVVQVPNFAQITDKRGLNAGWKLTVKQNGQFKTTDGNDTELVNAQLKMVKATTNSLLSPTLAPVTLPASLDPTGTNSSTIATALPVTGMGTWTMAFGADNTAGVEGVSLHVPLTTSKVKDVAYRTSLTWNLEDAP